MNKPKLIIIEGADGTGKSTQAKLLAKKIGARLVSQPSSDNIVGFIRAEAKGNPDFTALERQLLIGVSHTVDAFTKFEGGESIVMDRSYLSGIVYGKLTGLSGYGLALVTKILSTIYQSHVGDKYDVSVVFFDNPNRLDTPDKDVFESTIKWSDLKEEYNKLFQQLISNELKLFSADENIVKFIINSKNSIEETNRELGKILKL